MTDRDDEALIGELRDVLRSIHWHAVERTVNHGVFGANAERALATLDTLADRLSQTIRERDEAKKALGSLYELCMHASIDAWKNGVTDATGMIDEGDVRAGERLSEARTVLAALSKENTDNAG